MHHVERDDASSLVAPQHRAFIGVFDRVTPDGRVEVGHPHTDHAVAPIPLSERIAEDLIQLVDVVELRAIRTLDVLLAPRARRRHHATPASAPNGKLPPGISVSTLDAPDSSSYRTVTTRSSPSRTDSM